MNSVEDDPAAVTAQRTVTVSPAAVTAASPVTLATEDHLGPWLAGHWGVLGDAPPDLRDAIDL